MHRVLSQKAGLDFWLLLRDTGRANIRINGKEGLDIQYSNGSGAWINSQDGLHFKYSNGLCSAVGLAFCQCT